MALLLFTTHCVRFLCIRVCLSQPVFLPELRFHGRKASFCESADHHLLLSLKSQASLGVIGSGNHRITSHSIQARAEQQNTHPDCVNPWHWKNACTGIDGQHTHAQALSASGTNASRIRTFHLRLRLLGPTERGTEKSAVE